MSAAIKTMGLKRICMGCGSRFYDLNKRPITCPDCDVEFTGEIKPKTRRGAKAAEVKAEDPIKAEVEVKEETELAEEDDGVEVVSLEDAETKPQDEKEEEEEGVVGEDTLDDLPDVGVEIDSDDDDDALLDEDED